LANNAREVQLVLDHIQARRAPKIIPHTIWDSTYAEFLKGLEDQPGIIHLALHGFTPGFKFRAGDTDEPVKYSVLAAHLNELNSLSAVIATACFSAQPPLSQPERLCFARRLVALGVPAAVGMVGGITPRAAKVFSDSMYSELTAGQPMVQAYVSAILAIREMESYDRLLWSVPVLYANGNVAPLPTQDYLDLVDRVEGMIQCTETLQRYLARIHMIPQGRRKSVAHDIDLQMAAIRQDLKDIAQADVVGVRDPSSWHRRLDAQRELVQGQMSQVRALLDQGVGDEWQLTQTASLLASTLEKVGGLVTDHYPIT